MPDLRSLLQRHVDEGGLPGVVGLVAHGEQVEVATVGSVDVEGSAPMHRESQFRIASITKPLTAAAGMLLVDEGRLQLDDEVARWLPELAAPVVVRTPSSELDDVVPAVRPITVLDVLSSRYGHGFGDDFSLPALQPLFTELGQGPVSPDVDPDEWAARLSRVPLLAQPGERWLYNTSSDVLGLLVARVSGQPLPEFMAERLFAPLGMHGTGFSGRPDRLVSAYRPGEDGALELVDGPDGHASRPPRFPSGAGGLVSTVDDWLAFARMLLTGGAGLLSPGAVRLMTTDQLTATQRRDSQLFLEGQGWGFGGSVDVEPQQPGDVPGRYGWVGGTGTTAHLTPSTGAVGVLMTQREMNGPTAPEVMRDFWRYTAEVAAGTA